MPSPFPGMDPYLEEPDLWGDVHITMICAMRAALNSSLPDDLGAYIVLCEPPSMKRRRLHIGRFPEERLDTVIHLLAPCEKEPGERSDLYLSERANTLNEGKNWVDIDLLREGERYPAGDEGHYRVATWTSIGRGKPSILTFGLREPLPVIQIPLCPVTTGTAGIDLQWCLDRAFSEAIYERHNRYDRPPASPLREPDATWARELLASHSLQGTAT